MLHPNSKNNFNTVNVPVVVSSPMRELHHPNGDAPHRGPLAKLNSTVAPPLLIGQCKVPPSPGSPMQKKSSTHNNDKSNNNSLGRTPVKKVTATAAESGASPSGQAGGKKASGGERIIQPQNPPQRREATATKFQPAANATKNAQQQQQQKRPEQAVKAQDKAMAPVQATKPKPPPNPADEVGHFVFKIGDCIDKSNDFPDGRYKIVKQLGSGTYGKVVLCEDRKYQGAKVAVKLVRTQHLYRQSAKTEIKILRDLDGNNCTVKLLRNFEHKGHVSMSFELLGTSIDNVCRDKPMKLEHVRDVSMQILQALAFAHSKSIIHSDVKTENVLLVSQTDSAMFVKLVDFGSALYSSSWHPPLVGTMHYRAPEAILQAGWSFGIDIWAVGCIMVELITGKQLFELAHDDAHLAMMERALGPIPASLLHKGYSKQNQYNRSLMVRDMRGQIRLAQCRHEGVIQASRVSRVEELVEDEQLLDLIKRMLTFDPNQRITARDALLHPFFEVSCVDDSSDDIEVEAGPAMQPPSIKMPSGLAHDSGHGASSNTPTGLSRANTVSIICAPPRPPSPESVNSSGGESSSSQSSASQKRTSKLYPAPGLLKQDPGTPGTPLRAEVHL